MEQVLFAKQGRVASITLNRPDDENRITPKVLEQLGKIADALAKDDEVLAVILTGAGEKYFSAGMLHPKVRAKLRKEQILGIVRLANSVFDRIEALPQITIAALNGAARRRRGAYASLRHARRRCPRDVRRHGSQVGRFPRRRRPGSPACDRRTGAGARNSLHRAGARGPEDGAFWAGPRSLSQG